MSTKINVLVVEDEKNIGNFISTTLKNNHYKVIECQTGSEHYLLRVLTAQMLSY